MKQILLLLIFLSSSLGMAQVGVNTANPDPSSMLDISATNKGVLVPRVNLANVTTTTLDGTNTAATGLLIWNTNATTVGGNGIGFYFFNGTQWTPLTQAGTADHDFYEVGGTTPPDNISDNMFHIGDIAIGKNAPDTPLDIYSTGSDSSNIKNTITANTNGSEKIAIENTINGTSTDAFTVIKNNITSANNGNKNGVYNIFDTEGLIVRGIYNVFNYTQNSVNSSGYQLFGQENVFPINTGHANIGAKNTINTTSGNTQAGTQNTISAVNSEFIYGTINTLTGLKPIGTINGINSTSSSPTHPGIGTDNWFNPVNPNSENIGTRNAFYGAIATTNYGTKNLFTSTSSLSEYGIYNSFSPSNSSKYGLYNIFNNTSTGDKYGVYNLINSTAGGTHYGLYSNVLKSGSYAGYFLGNVSVGTTTLNNYILPPSRGTANQIMQTDGVGNVSWVTPTTVTDTDNQNIDVLSLTGDTLNISLQDDGVATQTVNLASIDNQATDVFSLTGTTLNLSLQNDGVATQTVNLSSLDTDNQIIDVLSLSGDTLSLSLQDDGVATQTLNIGAIDNQQIDVFSLTGNTLNLSLQNDGVAAQTVDLSSLKDHDWYEVGTSNSPNAITDAIYHYGDVAIGKNTADYALDIFENESSKSYAAQINKTDVDGGQSAGLAIAKATNGSGIGSNIYNTISSTNFLSETIGIHNYFTGNGSRDNTGMHNEFTVRSDYQRGIENLFDDVRGAQYGMFNRFGNITGANASVGVQNNWIATNTVNSDCIGLSNNMFSEGSGDRTGVYNSISGSGSGSKFGVFTSIDATAGGTHYGIYSNVRKANSYSGYFQGRVAIGTLPSDIYIMPLTRGTNGQIMQTDGVGNVSWVTPPADTDNQTIDVLSLSGDTLNISLQDDAVTTQTLNLSSIDNQATDVFSLIGSTLNLSLQNDGVATQTVDLSTLANDWKLTGNVGTTAGTNFIGTTDAQDLDFRTNNITKLTLTQRGQLSITNTGGSVLVGGGAGEADDFTSNQNTFIGTVSGESTSSGNLNSGLGFNTLNVNTLGFGNTAVGANALNVNVDGNNNTGLGRGANVSTSNLTNATAVGFNSTVNASNKIRFGNAAITVVEGQVAYTNPSDARFKFNVKEDVPGLDFIKKLKPVTYNFDTKKFDEHLNKNRSKEEMAIEDFATSTAIIRTGFLAQDVEKICADLGYNFDGLHIPDASNPTDNYGIAYSQFIMPIVKAVQEQQAIIETQKIELEQLKSELEKYKMLEERIKALEQK